MPSGRESEKPKVVEYLYTEYEAGNIPDGIVTSNHILAAIDATEADLSKSNPANFLKDIIRNDNGTVRGGCSNLSHTKKGKPNHFQIGFSRV
jgi:hypothetical protein